MTVSLAQIVTIVGAVLSVISTVVVAAVRLGRAYGRAESQAASLQNEVSELREQVRKYAARTGALEREAGRGRHAG